uniref:Uncharacterized protein n=1 Tax=Moniliophthora roreri TaxID=221103 RepID=A0A0W0EYZ6_MONRR
MDSNAFGERMETPAESAAFPPHPIGSYIAVATLGRTSDVSVGRAHQFEK